MLASNTTKVGARGLYLGLDSVGKHCATQVDERRKCCIIFAIKTKARAVVGKGEKSLLGDPAPTPHLSHVLGGKRRKEACEDALDRWDEKNATPIKVETPFDFRGSSWLKRAPTGTSRCPAARVLSGSYCWSTNC